MLLIHTNTYPGYWGRGKTIPEALKNMPHAKAGTEVTVYACADGAYIDGMGSICGIAKDAEPLMIGTINKRRTNINANNAVHS